MGVGVPAKGARVLTQPGPAGPALGGSPGPPRGSPPGEAAGMGLESLLLDSPDPGKTSLRDVFKCKAPDHCPPAAREFPQFSGEDPAAGLRDGPSQSTGWLSVPPEFRACMVVTRFSTPWGKDQP